MLPLIYLDYAATTPIHQAVIEDMLQCMAFNSHFGNPASSSHRFGQQAKQLVEQARAQVAELVNADADEIIWTSGATESNNLALKGIAEGLAHRGKHIISSKIEHKAVLDSCQALERQGFEVTYLQPELATGLIRPEMVQAALRPDTILVSLMMVNNELGSITDVAAIGALCQANGSVFHVDAAQAAGKLEIDLKRLPIDLMSFSAHKIYGPKGIGALYVRASQQAQLKAQIHGGGHERGLRSGTLASHQIIGMGSAFALAKQHYAAEQQRILALREQLLTGLSRLTEYQINAAADAHVANYLNISFTRANAGAIVQAIKSVAAISSGSACNSHHTTGSHVLSAIGLSQQLTAQTIRLSLGYYTTEADIQRLLSAIQAVSKSRYISL